MHDSTKPTFDSELGGAGVPIPYTVPYEYSVTVKPKPVLTGLRHFPLSDLDSDVCTRVRRSDAPLKYK